MAQFGFRTINEMVGQVGALDTALARAHWKAHKLDLSPVLHEPDSAFMNQDLYSSSKQDHGLDKALDQQLIVMCREALDSRKPVRFSTTIANVNRTVGTMLGHEVTKAYGGQGLAGRHHRHHLQRARRATASARSCPRASRCGCTATPTTTSARGCPAGGSWCGRRTTRRRTTSPKTTSSAAT